MTGWNLPTLGLVAGITLLVGIAVWLLRAPEPPRYWTGEPDRSEPRSGVTPLPPVYDWEDEDDYC